jgi:predicted HTH transcriptional regulator
LRSGQIEVCGRGIAKIFEVCKEQNLPEPFYRVRPNEVMIGFNTKTVSQEVSQEVSQVRFEKFLKYTQFFR